MSKITKSAKGQNCQVRISGVCNHNPETTVFAHLNGGGMAKKHSDLFGCYACSSCHTWLDGGYVKYSSREQRDLDHLQGMVRTQEVLLKEGLIEIK